MESKHIFHRNRKRGLVPSSTSSDDTRRSKKAGGFQRETEGSQKEGTSPTVLPQQELTQRRPIKIPQV